jgi:CHAT domain-containing protein/tetratricopeptide (TPR) repeat protein
MGDLMLKLILVVVWCLALFTIGFAEQVIRVPDDYTTIQSAINAVLPGGTIYIRAGHYKENLTIDKYLHLCGEDAPKTIIEGLSHTKPVVVVSPQSLFGKVTIESLFVKGGYRGIVVNGGGSVLIQSCIVALNETGILVRSNSVTIEECLIWQNRVGGIVLWPAHPTLYDQYTVHDNEIVLSLYGIVLRIAGKLNIYDNTIGQVAHGINGVSPSCGWQDDKFGRVLLAGLIVHGSGNKVHGATSAICPVVDKKPWPDGFIVPGFQEAVSTAVDQLGTAASIGTYTPNQGLQYIDNALAVMQGTPLLPLLADLYIVKGTLLMKEAPREAIEAFLLALPIVQERGMQTEIALVSEQLGTAYLAQEHYAEAYTHFSEAVENYLLLGNELKAAATETDAGISLAKQGKFREALDLFQVALQLYERNHGDQADVARLQANIGNILIEVGSFTQALELFYQAKGTFSDLRDWKDWLGCVVGLGTAYARSGRYEEGIAWFEQGRLVARREELKVQWVQCTVNVGTAYMEVGDVDKAITCYREAYDTLVEGPNREPMAILLMDLGVALWYTNQFSEAQACLLQARDLFDVRNMEDALAEVYGNLGLVLRSVGNLEEAVAQYEAAEEILRRQGRWEEVALTKMNIGVVDYQLKQYEEALSSHQEALNILKKTPLAAGMKYSSAATRWMILYNIGLCYEKQEKWKAAAKAYQDSIAVIESLRGYMKSEKLKTAWQQKTQHVYEHLIKLLINHGQGASAFPYAERCRARTFLDALYQGSILPEQLISPEAGISSGAVDPLAIDQAVENAREALQPNEAVLEYMVTDDGIYLWIITKEEIGYPVFIKYEREQLMNDVITLRKTLESDPPDQITMIEFLTSFYDKLVKESLAKLPDGVDALILIPSGPLWYLPFSALVMTDKELPAGPGTTRHPYLVERYTLAYLPSLASLSSLTKGETHAEGVRLLALADPELSPDQLREGQGSKCGEEKPLGRYEQLVAACQDFADLLVGEAQEEQCVYAGKEAQEVRAHVDTGKQIVVYAAHGQFNPYVPLQSKLLLAAGGEAANLHTDSRVPDGNYHAWEALLTDYRGTKLVILAACETLLPHLNDMKGTMAVLANQECEEVELTSKQLEQIVVGDEVVGLARAFLSSGAEAVLGTLWLANPTAIEELLTDMADYYKNEGDTWVQALTKAQRKLIKDNTFTNPWFWAPYQLIGRWR